tara:strand:+ start:7945 stop:9711 length:1767 start_codon:yes stop_codon:yes gene_type:complete
LIKKINFLASKKQKINLIILLCMMFFSALLETIGIAMVPIFVSLIIDIEKTINVINIEFIKDFINQIETGNLVIFFSLFLVALFIFKNLFVLVVLYFENLFFFKFKTDLSNRLFRIYINKSYSFHITKSPSEILRNTIKECSNVSNVILLLLSSLRESLVFFCLFVFLILLNPVVTLSIFSILILFSLIFVKIFRNKIYNWGKQSQKINKDLILKITEAFNSIKYIKISNSENFFKKNFYSLFKKNEKLTFFSQFINRSIRPYFELFSIIAISFLVIVLKINNFNFSNLLIILSLSAVSIVRILPIFNTVVSCITQIRFLHPSINVIYDEVYNSNISETDLDYHNDLDRIPFSNLTLKNINFSYPNKNQLIKNLNLNLKKGEKIGFIGSTGSGKTTIVDIMLGLQKPNSGEILLNQEILNKINHKLPLNIGYVPQDVYLLDDTLRRNILFNISESESISDDHIIKILDKLNLSHFLENNELGLDTIIGNNGIKLSGGERQRIGIARAFLKDPEIVFLDEATSALDNYTESEVMNNFIFSNKSLTSVMIAHRLTTLEKCDRVYYLSSGLVKDHGLLSEVIERNSELLKN